MSLTGIVMRERKGMLTPYEFPDGNGIYYSLAEIVVLESAGLGHSMRLPKDRKRRKATVVLAAFRMFRVNVPRSVVAAELGLLPVDVDELYADFKRGDNLEERWQEDQRKKALASITNG